MKRMSKLAEGAEAVASAGNADLGVQSGKSVAQAVLRRVWLLFRRRMSGALHSVLKSRGLFIADIVSALMALLFAFMLRYSVQGSGFPPDIYDRLLIAGPWYAGVCAVIFPLTGLYSRNWRYGSLSDLVTIIRAVVLTSAGLVSLLFFVTRLQDVPRSAIVIDALLLTAFLLSSRLSFRFDELRLLRIESVPVADRNDERIPALLVGAGDAADLYLRAARRDKNCRHLPVAILDATADHKGETLRDVPILGSVGEFRAIIDELKLEGRMPRHIIFTTSPSAFAECDVANLLSDAEVLGIPVSRLSQVTELRNARGKNAVELRAIELADLLERPQALLDHDAIVRLVQGRRVLVTGAGGSIGRELTLQIAACDPAELVLIENTEYNLYSIDMALNERFPHIPHYAHMCNVRRAKRVDDIFDLHRPELIFHAAALKHVPMVELNPCEGALTNVIGTMNVANAAKRTGALAFVQISTDKAVNPTSVMGATKRLAELYCQALDISGFESHRGPRFMTVRFGNVLGSSGSLIPLFERQLANGGPLTVTDPQMTRFFMTIREAVQLTLQASSYGLEGEIGQGEIFVLDMGEPIKIIDIARRMISLAGLTPDVDIAIKIIGLRPGEKLFEELFDTSEQRVPSPVPGVLGALPNSLPLALIEENFTRLQLYSELGDETMVLKILGDLIPGYERKPISTGATLIAAAEVATDAKSSFRAPDVMPSGAPTETQR